MKNPTVTGQAVSRIGSDVLAVVISLLVCGISTLSYAQPWRPHVLDKTLVNAWQIAVADLNGDNKLDIVATAGRSNDVVWYQAPDWTKNFIDANFSAASGLCLADVNRDQNLDVVVGGLPRIVWCEAPGWSQHVIHPGGGSTLDDVTIASVRAQIAI